MFDCLSVRLKLVETTQSSSFLLRSFSGLFKVSVGSLNSLLRSCLSIRLAQTFLEIFLRSVSVHISSLRLVHGLVGA